MSEIIYVLTNEAMPGLVKIGRTKDLEKRIKELSSATGVPVSFECRFAATVKNCAVIEKKLHDLFAPDRVHKKKEFFRVSPERVVIAISLADHKEITSGIVPVDQEDQDAIAKTKRPNIKLEAIGIKEGDILTLSRNNKIDAIVTHGNKVIYKDEVMSLSAAALSALQSLGYKATSVSGSDYWMYEGETLDERRIRIESEQFDEK